ncbi:hypothetical protein OUZ56_008735 [Daphnia magna]|uniref:Uncharacterized protein n=1 Tax=Daphnia magna TaxID=35525 RepID=A0ABR0AE10_9CRUS|nr:hypothetical protein OUZ56_008735 [Daphnia magna]
MSSTQQTEANQICSASSGSQPSGDPIARPNLKELLFRTMCPHICCLVLRNRPKMEKTRHYSQTVRSTRRVMTISNPPYNKCYPLFDSTIQASEDLHLN